MGLFRPDAGPFLLERRAARRWRATCAAALETLGGESPGQLWDLSETGAGIKLDVPPAPGSKAILKFGDQRIRCSVAWANDEMCGVAFDEPLGRAVVSATARLIGDVETPVAAFRNIRMGRKRSDPDCNPGILSHPLEAGPSKLTIALQKRRGLPPAPPSGSLTAAEEMFFFGSPLAHVLAFETHLQASIAGLSNAAGPRTA